MIFLYPIITIRTRLKTLLYKLLKKRRSEDYCVNLASKPTIFLCLILIFSPFIFSLDNQAEAQTVAPEIVQFNVAAQPVDKALIKLAQQTDQTILF